MAYEEKHIEAGIHRIKISKPGYQSIQADIAVPPDSVIRKSYHLAADFQQTLNLTRTIKSQNDKKQFLEAREKLTHAIGLSPTDEASRLLASVNSSLAGFLVGRAKLALNRTPKLFATALLYLQAAQMYEPGGSELEALLNQVREPARQKAQIRAGVVITSPVGQCAEFAQPIAEAVESALVGGGRTSIQLLGRDQASVRLQRMRSGAVTATADNYAIISGQIRVCNLQPNRVQQQVSSKIQRQNPNRTQLDTTISNYDRRVDNCKKQYPQTEQRDCNPLRQERQNVRDQLSREPLYNESPYSYTKVTTTASGQMRLTLQIDDSILRKTGFAGEATGTAKYDCTAVIGVQKDDYQGARNSSCPEFDQRALYAQMAEQVQAEAQTQAATAIRGVAKSYLELARRAAADQGMALENYILFALLSSDKSGQDYQQALASIHARDADLNPETALR